MYIYDHALIPKTITINTINMKTAVLVFSDPKTVERFLKAVNNALQTNLSASQPVNENKENYTEPNRFLYFRVDRKMVKVLLNDILFIEGLKDYVKIFTARKTIVTKQVLSTLEELLPSDEFLRIHRSYIVSIDKIDSYNTDILEIAKKELPIGRMYRHKVTKILNASSINGNSHVNAKNRP
jgi:DNA-binding LytR/AlgR family response regulator